MVLVSGLEVVCISLMSDGCSGDVRFDIFTKCRVKPQKGFVCCIWYIGICVYHFVLKFESKVALF